MSIYFAISNLLSIVSPTSYNWSPAQFSKGYLAALPWGSAPAQGLGAAGHTPSSAAEQPDAWSGTSEVALPSLANPFFVALWQIRSIHTHPFTYYLPTGDGDSQLITTTPFTGPVLSKHPRSHLFPFQRSLWLRGRWQALGPGWLPG